MQLYEPKTSERREAARAVIFAVVTFVFGLFLTYTVRRAVDAAESKHADHVVALEAERITDEMRETLHQRSMALHRLADRWESRGGTPEREWTVDVGGIINDLGGIKAIDWVDRDLTLRWIAPVQGTRHLVGTRFGGDRIRNEVLAQARASQHMTATPLIPLLLGGTGYLMIFPLRVKNRDDGYILGAFDIEAILSKHVPKAGFQVVLADARTGIRVTTRNEDEWAPEHTARRTLDYHDFHWTLEVVPSTQILGPSTTVLASLTPALGLLLSTVLAALVFLLAVRQTMTRTLQRVLADVSLYKFALDKGSMVGFADADRNYTYVNEKFCEISGYAFHELVGQSHSIMDVGDGPAPWHADLRATLNAGRTWQGEIKERAKNGQIQWHDCTVVPRIDENGHVYQYISIRRDITLRKQMEKQFELMVENLPAGAMLLNANGLFINETLEKLTGYTRAEVPNLERWFELMFGDRAEAAMDLYAKNVADGFAKSSIVPARMKSGETRYLEFTGGRDGTSEIWLIMDVTEKVAAQERFELVFQHSADGQILLEPGPKGLHIIDANPAAVNMVRARSKAELIGRTPLDFTPPVLRGSVRSEELFRDLMKQANTERVMQVEWERARLDGTAFPVRVTISPVKVDGRTIFLSTWHDLTAENAAQAKLVQNSKMVSLGEMAGGLAHELNTPLATIKGKVQQLALLSQRGAVDAESLRGGLAKVEATVDRISRIVGGLRAFSGEGDQDPLTHQSVATIVDDALDFCHTRLANHDITLRLEIPPGLRAACRPWQVSQVVLNLLNNAFDATAGRRHGWIEIQAAEVDGRVEIRVTDSGPGVPKDIRSKIMQPFFTTKEVGSGTGLGLSVAKGLLESQSGTLELDETRANTCFVIRLNADPNPASRVA